MIETEVDKYSRDNKGSEPSLPTYSARVREGLRNNRRPTSLAS